jgi:ribosomal protein L7Ae-like RNA K-turn-binding protein
MKAFNHLDTNKAPICSSEVKTVVLERLQKEIISKLRKSSYRKIKKRKRSESESESESETPPKLLSESVVRSRLRCGINQCTRALEDELQSPKLIILARDVRPATIFEHILVYAQIRNIPILLLPGRASLELGEAVGLRTCAALAFLARDSCSYQDDNKANMEEWNECNIDIDAFIAYVVSKIPK